MTAPTGAVIAALDVGSVRNLGWWRSDDGAGRGGTDLDAFCDVLSGDLLAGRPVALGFEAPLWVPRARTSADLGRARVGDGSRAWSAGAGPTVLAYGLQQSTFVLDALAGVVPGLSAGLDPAAWFAGAFPLLVWEAFVSAAGKDRTSDDPHVSDARAATEACVQRLARVDPVSDCEPDRVISLGGLALQVSGLARDPSVLGEAALVVRVAR